MNDRVTYRSFATELRNRYLTWLWALGFWLVGTVVMAVIEVKSIQRHSSSTAAIGFLFIPFYAVPAGLITALWGISIRNVWHSLRGLRQMAQWLIIGSWGLAFILPTAITREVVQGLRLKTAVDEVHRMKDEQLDVAFDHSPWKRNKYLLGAIAQNANASTDLLDRIASIPDSALYEKMWSHWDLMGVNSRGLAVMRLVIDHRNVSATTLEKLASSPYANEYVLSDLLSNQKTPLEVLKKHADTRELVMKWSLARNPNTPIEVLERLAKDLDRYTADGARYTLQELKANRK